MKTNYSKELIDTLKHSQKIKQIYKTWERSKTGYKYPEKGAAYKNYLLIYCYGKIETIFKHLVADYFAQESMPQRCKQFADKIRERLPSNLTKDGINRFIREECGSDWLTELHTREKSTTYRCIHNRNYTYYDVILAVNFLTNLRNSFAHGQECYTGSIDDIIVYYKKSIVWLYEIDDVINKFQ